MSLTIPLWMATRSMSTFEVKEKQAEIKFSIYLLLILITFILYIKLCGTRAKKKDDLEIGCEKYPKHRDCGSWLMISDGWINFRCQYMVYEYDLFSQNIYKSIELS